MNYKLKIDGKIWDVQADKLESGDFAVTIDGRTRKISEIATAPFCCQAILDGSLQKLVVVPGPDGLWVWNNGKARLVIDASQAAPREASDGLDDAPQEVTSATPATVISVEVKTGDAVVKGQALVLVSAMKMETTLAAPFDGTVTAVNTEPGAFVNPGEILVELEPIQSQIGADGK